MLKDFNFQAAYSGETCHPIRPKPATICSGRGCDGRYVCEATGGESRPARKLTRLIDSRPSCVSLACGRCGGIAGSSLQKPTETKELEVFALNYLDK